MSLAIWAGDLIFTLNMDVFGSLGRQVDFPIEMDVFGHLGREV